MNLLKLKSFLLGIIFLCAISCDKKEQKPDDILFIQIGKTVTSSALDSINGTCKDIIFKVSKNLQNDNDVILFSNSIPILCDGSNEFLADIENENVLVLELHTKISDSGNWSSNTLNINDFSGKGEKYIGYRSNVFPTGKSIYNYGWIKVELSAQRDTLRIISRADNLTSYNIIRAGQVE